MKTILVAGATGNLGEKMMDRLLEKEVRVRIVLRKQKDRSVIAGFTNKGVDVREVDMDNKAEMLKVCQDADCVISMLSGLREVVVGTQKTLLDAAVASGVPRFIPSDFSIDYRNLVMGNNRNLDFRKEFYAYLKTQPIQSTTIFNGALMELIKTDMPLILRKRKRILCWGNCNQPMEFTHSEDIAAYAAEVCLDDTTPRHLFIAGSALSCNDFVKLLSEMTGKNYKLFRPGGIGLMNVFIKLAKTFAPGKGEVYPAWQGMQYVRDMMEGRVELQEVYSNNRYPHVRLRTVKDFLTEDNWVMEASSNKVK